MLAQKECYPKADIGPAVGAYAIVRKSTSPLPVHDPIRRMTRPI